MYRYSRYLFFKQHAGGVGRKDSNGRIAWEHARRALELARAEQLLSDAEEVARIEWENDDVPYDHGILTDEEVAAKFESNEWTGPYACLLYVGNEIVASLAGIVVGPTGLNDPYCRVVEAELAEEAEDEIRQALGDARDSRITCPA